MHSRTKKTNQNDQISSSNSTFFKKEAEQKNDFFSKSNQEPFFNSSNLIQAKLSIGEPDDKYEEEADAMADQVIKRSKMPDSMIAQAPEIQSKCSACEEEEEAQTKLEIQRQEEEEEEMQMQPLEEEEEVLQMQEEEEEEELQMKGNNLQKTNAPSDFESKMRSSSMGQSIPENVRQEMETGLGADFSGVRIHNDSNAVNLSSEINAQAFTHGNDIYFNKGKFNPESTTGKHLLAHELTHTIQQGKSRLKPKIQRDILQHGSLPVHTPFTPDQTAAFTQLIQTYLDSPSNETGRAAVSAITAALEQAGEVQYNRPEVTDNSPQFNLRPGITASQTLGSNNSTAGYTFPINGRIKVEIYPRAFTGTDVNNSLGFLAGVIIHEYIHVMQNLAGPGGSDAQREFQAWLWQAEHITELGISTGTEAARQIAGKLRDYFGRLTSSERTRRIRRRFSDAIETLSPPPQQATPDISQQVEEEEEQLQLKEIEIQKVDDPKVSTPIPSSATKNKSTGIHNLTINDVKVEIHPDVFVKGKKGGETEFELNPKTWKYDGYDTDSNGIITKVKNPPKIPKVIIKTTYGLTVKPGSTSAYGRGTTPADKKAGNTSLRFHEGSHGTDFLKYLTDNPFPKFPEGVGTKKSDFLKAVEKYKTARGEYGKKMDEFSKKRTDCVGYTIDKYHKDNAKPGETFPITCGP